MIKKQLITFILMLFTMSFITCASSMTALDYATISAQDIKETTVNKELEKEMKAAKNKQKTKDRYSGPAALETSGNFVVNPDTTNYFPETVATEQLSEYVEATDPRYGISFKSKRHYKTNQGEFDLIDAYFEPVENDYYSDYHFVLNVKKVDNRVKLPYLIYVKAYNAAGAFVDYSYTVFDDSATFEKSLSISLFKNNDRHVARIEFSLDTSGIDPAVVAKNNVSKLCFGYPDIFEKLADPNSDYTEERKAKIMETYNKEYEYHYNQAVQDASRQNDIYEIQ